jgi:hypothetical protein
VVARWWPVAAMAYVLAVLGLQEFELRVVGS